MKNPFKTSFRGGNQQGYNAFIIPWTLNPAAATTSTCTVTTGGSAEGQITRAPHTGPLCTRLQGKARNKG